MKSTEHLKESTKKLADYMKSEEGILHMKNYFAEINQKQAMQDSQVDRFWIKCQNTLNVFLDTFVERLVVKYDSDKYRDMWYKRGIEPRAELYSFLFEVAKKHGKEFTQSEYENKEDSMFTAAVYVLGGWEFELIQGQGSAILIRKHVDNSEQILIKIINDELGRGNASKFIGNCNIVCAMRLLHECGNVHDFDKTMMLAKFIDGSWTDLELNKEQEQDILLQLRYILTLKASR